jgi:hypothetical protein
MILGPDDGFQDLVGSLHGHATEIRNQMCTMSMASETTF